MALRRSQLVHYFEPSTKQSLFRDAFGLPEGEEAQIDLHAVLSLVGKSEVYSGKVYITAAFLCFASLDRKSCRLSLPLATIRRVEKLPAGTAGGAMALSMTLCSGSKIIFGLNGLRGSCDQFCSTLRTNLKAVLPQMKALKPMLNTFFSEVIIKSDEKSPIKAGKEDRNWIDASDEEQKVDGEGESFTTASGTDHGYHGGLGLVFKFPGDARKLKERSKMKLWKDYFLTHGQNLTLIRYPPFSRLVQVGLPSRLRGEIWELTSGSLHLRLSHPGEYAKILKDHEGKTSLSTDEIEKDLNRSLPEYPAYQHKKGIETLRRVLTAYSWKNPDLGYCQAMNIVVAAFLIYTSEEQCFWLLNVLCDRLVQGYYSPSMYGTLLDQRVFENLFARCLPVLHEHFQTADIQLSMASLPWFLSFFINSMPMIFAFRVVDCFFLMGPKVLFQIGLAILKINGEELLACNDDGHFISIMRNYFNTLGNSANPNSSDSRMRQITRFQELLVVAFGEFGIITDDTIINERKRFQSQIVDSIETFAKRTAIRNLSFFGQHDKSALGRILDNFQLSIYKARAELGIVTTPTFKTGAKGEKDERPELRINRKVFGYFMSETASWAREEYLIKNGFIERHQRKVAEHEFIDRIFSLWDVDYCGALSYQDVVRGLDQVLYNDLMSNISWFFNMHDKNKDGYLTKDEVLQLSEDLLFIFRNEPGDQYLAAVSRLMMNAFEFAEDDPAIKADAQTNGKDDETEKETLVDVPRPSSASDNPNRPYLNLATFRMVVLADELLESFFDQDLTRTWSLQELIEETPVPRKNSFLRGLAGNLADAFLTDDNKEKLGQLADKLADEVGKRLDIHSVEHQPSIGRLAGAAALQEPRTRESLLRPQSKPAGPSRTPSSESESSAVSPLSAAAMRQPAYPPIAPILQAPSLSLPEDDNPIRPSLIATRSASFLEDRPKFSIDEAGETDDDFDEDDFGDADDKQLMDDVDAFLATAGGESSDLIKDDTAAKLKASAEKAEQLI